MYIYIYTHALPLENKNCKTLSLPSFQFSGYEAEHAVLSLHCHYKLHRYRAVKNWKKGFTNDNLIQDILGKAFRLARLMILHPSPLSSRRTRHPSSTFSKAEASTIAALALLIVRQNAIATLAIKEPHGTARGHSLSTAAAAATVIYCYCYYWYVLGEVVYTWNTLDEVSGHFCVASLKGNSPKNYPNPPGTWLMVLHIWGLRNWVLNWNFPCLGPASGWRVTNRNLHLTIAKIMLQIENHETHPSKLQQMELQKYRFGSYMCFWSSFPGGLSGLWRTPRREVFPSPDVT